MGRLMAVVSICPKAVVHAVTHSDKIRLILFMVNEC